MPKLTLTVSGYESDLVDLVVYASKRCAINKADFVTDRPAKATLTTKRVRGRQPFQEGQSVVVTRTLKSYGVERGDKGQVTEVKRAGKGFTVRVDFGEGPKPVPRTGLRGARS